MTKRLAAGTSNRTVKQRNLADQHSVRSMRSPNHCKVWVGEINEASALRNRDGLSHLSNNRTVLFLLHFAISEHPATFGYSNCQQLTVRKMEWRWIDHQWIDRSPFLAGPAQYSFFSSASKTVGLIWTPYEVNSHSASKKVGVIRTPNDTTSDQNDVNSFCAPNRERVQ